MFARDDHAVAPSLGMEHNFIKYDNFTSTDVNTPYDYDSVMHYGRTAFSRNGLPTMEPIRSPNATIGQRNNLSAIDVQAVRRFYNCSATGTTLPPVTTPSTGTQIVQHRFAVQFLFSVSVLHEHHVLIELDHGQPAIQPVRCAERHVLLPRHSRDRFHRELLPIQEQQLGRHVLLRVRGQFSARVATSQSACVR